MRRATTLFIVTALMLPVAALSAQAINDAQIAAIVVTANQVDIDAGKLAGSSASDPQGLTGSISRRPIERRSIGRRVRGYRAVRAREPVELRERADGRAREQPRDRGHRRGVTAALARGVGGQRGSALTFRRRPRTRSACQRSHLACRVSQICASQRVKPSRSSAVSALTARRPRMTR